MRHHAFICRGFPLLRTALAAAAMCVALAGTAGAQVIDPDDYAIAQNPYLIVALGEEGTTDGVAAPQGANAGRIWLIDRATGAVLLYGPTLNNIGAGGAVPVTGSFFTIRLNGGEPKPDPFGNPPDPNTPGWDLIFGDTRTRLRDGTFLDGVGEWIQPPTSSGDKITASWRTLPGPNAANPIPTIQVNLEITLIHDMASFKLSVRSGANVPGIGEVPGAGGERVGIRFAQNYGANGGLLEGPIVLPDGGEICTETVLVGPSVPAFWTVYSGTAPNTRTSGGILKPTGAPLGTLVPDRMIVAPNTLMETNWDFILGGVPGFTLCNPANPWNGTAGIYWDERVLTGGGSFTNFVTYFGRNAHTMDFVPPMPAGVRGPLTLNYDPSKPQNAQEVGTITAFVVNQAGGSLSRVAARLVLPEGLELADGTAEIDRGSVAAGAEATFSWSVRATGGTNTGPLTYTVIFSAEPGPLGKAISRVVTVPSIPVRRFTGDLQMVSFPFIFADNSPEAALGLSRTEFDIVRWDTARGEYMAVDRIQPGKGYWLDLAAGRTVTLNGATNITATEFDMALVPGWNQIGNPFNLPASAAQLVVIITDPTDPDYLREVPVTEAASGTRQWILPGVYRYDPAAGQYEFDPDFQEPLAPFVGYWVKANRDNLILRIRRPVARSPITRAAAAKPQRVPGEWKLRIVASAEGKSDGSTFIGLAAGAADAADIKDIEKPPAISNRLTVGIDRTNWPKGRAGLYAQDIQSPAGARKVWRLVVTTPRPNTEVTLAWPEIGSVPRTHELYVTDLTTGVRKAMRQSSSLRINTGEAASRAFEISADLRAGSQVFRITQLRVEPTRSRAAAQIAFTTTRDASVRVRILKSGGAPVRSLASRATPSGTTQLLWDYRDDRGVSVPAGVYTIEVSGTTSDGQSTRMVAPHIVLR